MSVRVLIVDDSAFIRRALKRILRQTEEFEVVASASNGRLALRALEDTDVDVVILDIEMPIMNGIETLKEIRKTSRTLPVVMFSTLTTKGAESTLEALSLGASDYVTKPSNHESAEDAFRSVEDDLLPRLRALTVSRRPGPDAPSIASPTAIPTGNVPATASGTPSIPKPRFDADEAARARDRARHSAIELLAIGVSTGGPTALQTLFRALPADLGIPAVVVQHMPPIFTGLLAQRLDTLSAWQVREANGGEPMEPGVAYLAPGGHHLVLTKREGRIVTALDEGAPVNSCRPAVDVLFESVAAHYGGNVLAVILTGMGQDGLEGCRTLVQRGAHCFAQDAESSVVWGMPGYIAKEGLADKVLSIDDMAKEITQCVRVAHRLQRPTMA